GTLDISDAVLLGAVVVRVKRNSERVRSRNERVAQRIGLIVGRDRERTGTAAESIVADTDAGLAAPKVGKDLGITPPRVAHRSPAIKIAAMPSSVDVTVDCSGSPERLATRLHDASAPGSPARLGRKHPVEARVSHCIDDRSRNVDRRVVIT